MKTSLQHVESPILRSYADNVIQSLDLFVHATSVPSTVVAKPKLVTYGGVTADEFYEVIQDIMYHLVALFLLYF